MIPNSILPSDKVIEGFIEIVTKDFMNFNPCSPNQFNLSKDQLRAKLTLEKNHFNHHQKGRQRL